MFVSGFSLEFDEKGFQIYKKSSKNTFLSSKAWKDKIYFKNCVFFRKKSKRWYDAKIFGEHFNLYSEWKYFWMILTSIPPSDHFRAEQQHRLILSIKAPLDQEDLFQPSNCTTQIKRGSNKYMHQKVAFFIMPPTFPNAGTLENAKTPLVPYIKEGTVCLCAKNTLLDSKDLVLFFWFTCNFFLMLIGFMN